MKNVKNIAGFTFCSLVLLFLLSFSLKGKNMVLSPNITSYCIYGETNTVTFSWEYNTRHNGRFGVYVGNETLAVPVYYNADYDGTSITITSSLIQPGHTLTLNVFKDGNTSPDVYVTVPYDELPNCLIY